MDKCKPVSTVETIFKWLPGVTVGIYVSGYKSVSLYFDTSCAYTQPCGDVETTSVHLESRHEPTTGREFP